jgi:hypothetical protein
MEKQHPSSKRRRLQEQHDREDEEEVLENQEREEAEAEAEVVEQRRRHPFSEEEEEEEEEGEGEEEGQDDASSVSSTSALPASGGKTRGRPKGIPFGNPLILDLVDLSCDFLKTNSPTREQYRRALQTSSNGALHRAFEKIKPVGEIAAIIKSGGDEGIPKLADSFFTVATDVNNPSMKTRKIRNIRALLTARQPPIKPSQPPQPRKDKPAPSQPTATIKPPPPQTPAPKKPSSSSAAAAAAAAFASSSSSSTPTSTPVAAAAAVVATASGPLQETSAEVVVAKSLAAADDAIYSTASLAPPERLTELHNKGMYLVLCSEDELSDILGENDGRRFFTTRELLCDKSTHPTVIPAAVYRAVVASIPGLSPSYAQDVYRILFSRHAAGIISTDVLKDTLPRLGSDSLSFDAMVMAGRLIEMCRLFYSYLSKNDRDGAFRVCQTLGLHVALTDL